jgi:hypothetical protein
LPALRCLAGYMDCLNWSMAFFMHSPVMDESFQQ